MGIYIGNTQIAKVYQGSTVLNRLNLGGSTLWINQTVTPTITYVSSGESALVFNITNNDPATSTIYYEHSDSTPDAGTVSLAPGASTNITVSGLAGLTTYTVYAFATAAGKDSSPVTSSTGTTVGWTQLGTEKPKTAAQQITVNGATWWNASWGNGSISKTHWKLVATSDSGAWSNEYWTNLYFASNTGVTYNSSSTTTISYSGYIVTYINNPGNAFSGGYTAASVSGGNHNGSTIFITFNTPVTLNTIRIQTGYTKINGMTLYYL